MTDLKSRTPSLFLREEELRRGIELLYFAYRDFHGDPDALLQQYEFGRAHHRVIHFVGRKPGMTVSELLDILRITKQSLSRVLSTLIEQGFVRQDKGVQDKRQRLLHLTDKGIELERNLSALQRDRMARAYRESGVEAVAGFWKVLTGLIDQDEQQNVANFIAKR